MEFLIWNNAVKNGFALIDVTLMYPALFFNQECTNLSGNGQVAYKSPLMTT